MNFDKLLGLLTIATLLGPGEFSLPAAAKDTPLKLTKPIAVVSDKATIQLKTLTLTHNPPIAGPPGVNQATVQYPIVTSGPNPAVLKQVQTAIGLKQILGESIEEIKTDFQESHWLRSIRYVVNYNQKSVLQLTYTREGMGAYPSSNDSYGAVDLQTGQPIEAADLFTPTGLSKVQVTLNQMMATRIQQAIVEKTKEYQLEPDHLKSNLAGKQFEANDLNKFVIGEKGITFIYDFDFPHVSKALEPDGKFFLSYAQLKLNLQTKGVAARLSR
jgi:hypothetical protein